MLWNWYTIDACFFSASWQITSNVSFAATCVGVTLLVIFLEALRRVSREYDDWILRTFEARMAQIEGDRPSPPAEGRRLTATMRATPVQQLVRSVLHAVVFAVAYVVMLLAMYYNGYIIISIFIGAGLGKFLCDWMTRTMVVGGLKEGTQRTVAEEPTVCCG